MHRRFKLLLLTGLLAGACALAAPASELPPDPGPDVGTVDPADAQALDAEASPDAGVRWDAAAGPVMGQPDPSTWLSDAGTCRLCRPLPNVGNGCPRETWSDGQTCWSKSRCEPKGGISPMPTTASLHCSGGTCTCSSSTKGDFRTFPAPDDVCQNEPAFLCAWSCLCGFF